MKRKRPAKGSSADPLTARFTRLTAKLRQSTKPIIWLRAIPGAGKTRFLHTLKKDDKTQGGWRLLDAPTPAAVHKVLASAGALGERHPTQKLLIASTANADIARSLLVPDVYGFVDVIEDNDLFPTPADCRQEQGLFAATAGWPVLVDAWARNRADDIKAMLPDFLESEVLPQLPPPLVTALFAALAAPLRPAAVEYLFGQGKPLHPLLAPTTAGTSIAGSWIRDALLTFHGTPESLPPKVRDQLIHVHTTFAEPATAITSLIDIGQTERAVQVFERAGGIFFGYLHGFQGLGEVLQKFGPEWERRLDSLFFAHQYLLNKTGQSHQALLRLESRYPGVPVDLRRQRLTQSPYAILMRIDLSLDIDDTPPVEVITSWGRLEALFPAGDELARGVLYNTMAVGFLQLGALVQAKQLAEEAMAAYERGGSPYLVHFMLLHLADLALRQGRPRDATELVRRADAALRTSRLEFNSEFSIIDSFRARIAYEEGRFDDCPTDIEPLLQALLRGDSWSDLMSTTAGHFVFTAYYLQGLRSALDRFDHCMLTLSRRHGASQSHALLLIRIRLLQIARRYTEAAQYLDDYDLHPATRRSPHEETDKSLVRLRQLVVRHRDAAGSRQLADALEGAPGLESRHKISLAILQAELRSRAGEHAPARRHLSVALRHAEADNLRGVLIEEGQFLERLLPLFIETPGPSNVRLVPFAQRVLRLLNALPAAPLRAKSLSGISRQEHRVLSYVADGSTNKQIARALKLSESAVKFHLRNLFRKLNVTSRGALRDAAEQRGIVT
jgi:DNA-binding CsgD family transcriptional regulator